MIENLFFETIRCDDMEIYNLAFHKKRMSNTVGINFNLEEYIHPINSKLLRCKVIYNDSEIVSIEYFPYEKKEIKQLKIIVDDNIEYEKKYLNRQCIDKHLQENKDCDEIIIVKNDLVADTSIANIAIFYNDQWLTPKLPLLKGTMRAKLLENGTIKEKDITIDMLKKASKMATMNAMVGFNILDEYTLI
jgi:4-amino-4-deoxychorismate lyase